ncbi:hypothetical protein J5N97_016577 [Dioscorea zingiberensis]|uniref:40S ribosomal protein S27 n=1 Tax=Dioscorea zingiberensis TaxID=325984 RepID=A0A9D5HFT1_9LILI|nr:hypothetical protein J5N97_016577 [Dioscorea zingiberensis]
MVLPNDIDLLNPPAELEKRRHKLKRLVQSPNSFFMDVKCQGCFNITTVFSHSQTVVVCGNCQTVLCQPTGGRARLTEGKQNQDRRHREGTTTHHGETNGRVADAPTGPEQRRGEQRDLARPAHNPAPAPREDRGKARGGEPSERKTTALEAERKSFCEAITGRRMNSSDSGNKLETGASSQAETETGSLKERPWELVCRKKKRRHSPVEGYMHMTGPSKEGHPRQRHSPLLKRTSSGVVEVCGKCRRPGHVMKEFWREEVCRRC